MKIMNEYKPVRRKTWAFYSVQLICAIAAYKSGITWACAALSGGAFLVYVGAISTEKILLTWLNRGGKCDKT
jgi:hypothetical protein